MRNIITPLLFATLLAGFSTVASAATEVRSSEGHQPVGSVSITGASNVDDAVKALAEKAGAQGVPYFKTLAVGGKNKLYASAELLK